MTKATIQTVAAKLADKGYALGHSQVALRDGKFIVSYPVTFPNGDERLLLASEVANLFVKLS